MKIDKMHRLQDAFDKIQKHCQTYHLADKACNDLHLVCEELIVNLLEHAQAKYFHFGLSYNDELTSVYIDYLGNEFNPLEVSKETTKKVEDMDYGGIGLILVNALASEIIYKYDKKHSLNVIKINL